MKEIMEIVEHVEEEIQDAKEYATLAAHYKGKHDALSATYLELAQQEMVHMDKLHQRAAELIMQHRKEHGEPPKEMMAVYDWEHKKHMEKAGEARALIDLVKAK